VAVASASLGDVIAWAALAFLSSLAGSAHPSLGTTLLLIAGYGVLMITVVAPSLRWGVRCLRLRDARFALILIAALASAAATEWIGIHPLFGSFFLGALLSGDEQLTTDLAERIESLTVTLLLPLFFAFTGLRTNVNLLPSFGLMVETGLIVLAAIIGKVAAPVVIGRANGFSWREALALGALMNTRGLVELVVLNIGVDLGLLPPVLFTMLVLMAFITTTMTSPLLTYLGFGHTGTSAPGASKPSTQIA
jgi:Kef-type K+ transport system membrane component KefB